VGVCVYLKNVIYGVSFRFLLTVVVNLRKSLQSQGSTFQRWNLKWRTWCRGVRVLNLSSWIVTRKYVRLDMKLLY